MTYHLLGERYSSWEMYYRAKDDHLLDVLKRGLLPGVIAMEIVEWLLVERVWQALVFRVSDIYKDYYSIWNPRSAHDFLRAVYYFEAQANNNQDIPASEAAQRLKREFEDRIKGYMALKDTDNLRAGQIASEIIDTAEKYIRTQYIGLNSVKEFATEIQSGKYMFDVMSKIRELILLYARRSRRLY